MRYSVFSVARAYCVAFSDFSAGCRFSGGDYGFSLFMYSVKSLYGVETNEFSIDVKRYGYKCIQALKKVKGVPKKPETMSFEDRIAVVNMCSSIFASLVLVENRGGGVACQVLNCPS